MRHLKISCTFPLIFHQITIVITQVSSSPTSDGLPKYCNDEINGESILPQCSKYSDLHLARAQAGNEDRSELLPSWINLTLANEGQSFASNYLQGTMFGHLIGLFFVISFPDGFQVLKYTTMSGTPEDAARRYQSTLAQVLLWYQSSGIKDPNIWTSLANVRKRHIAAQNASISHGFPLLNETFSTGTLTSVMSGPFFQDLEASDIPLNQRSPGPSHWNNVSVVLFNQQIMALTQFAFVGPIFLYPQRLGIYSASKEDLFAFNHLWAVLGWALGINDKFNVALQPDFDSQLNYYQSLFDDYYIPSLFNMDEPTKLFVEAMLGGISNIVPAASPNFMLYQTLTSFLLIPAPNTFKILTFKEKRLSEIAATASLPSVQNNYILRFQGNQIVSAYFYMTGVYYFGFNYTTPSLRASTCFYSKYGNE